MKDPKIFEINFSPIFTALPNEGSTEDIESGEERNEEPSNHKEEGKENDSESWQEENLEEKRNADTSSSSFFQEEMMQNILAQFFSTVEVTHYSIVYCTLV